MRENKTHAGVEVCGDGDGGGYHGGDDGGGYRFRTRENNKNACGGDLALGEATNSLREKIKTQYY